MTPELHPIADRLERAVHADDSIEGERLRRLVRARLLDETAPETRIDRFVVLGRIGEGGMGVVYSAYDAKLDRKIAIKVVRTFGGLPRADADRQRLVREARALAKLSHPNVVAIYDVGLHREGVFIAMELVQGGTLRAYTIGEPRPWREILGAYLQAGEGLAAAHRAGLVHRDFKPDNALVGEDGRVRVADFGLARGHEACVSGTTSPGHAGGSLTATGKIMGTPAYMAPEQNAGHEVDARSDQFSFCVALWEALYRVRPARGDDTTSSSRAQGDARPSSHVRRDEVPTWLRAVLLRGLSPNPADRWPAMGALLDACARDPTPRRRVLGAVAVVLAAIAAAFAGLHVARMRAEAACAARADDLRPVWNADTSKRIVDAFASTGLQHAAVTAQRVDARLSTWSESWSAARQSACVAHELDGVLDIDARTRRDACLDEHADRLGMFVELLVREPDRDTLNSAMRAALELPPASECEDDARLAATAAELPDGTTATDLVDIRRELARSVLLVALGQADDARATAEAARMAAVAAGAPALEAEATIRVGRWHTGEGEYEQAEVLFERAYFTATQAGADEVALDAASQLVMILGVRLGRYDEALRWSRHARGLLERVDESDDYRAAALEEQLASLHMFRGDHDLALKNYERALALWTDDAGPDSPQVGEILANLASLHTQRGDLDAADGALARAERILGAAHGEDSLELVSVVGNRCSNLFARGRLEPALVHCKRALAIREARLNPDHPGIAISSSNLATAYSALGQLDAARPLLERAIAIRRERFGPTHPALATTLANLGNLEAAAGDFDAALPYFREALGIRRQGLPAGHPDTIATILDLAEAHATRGDHRRARAYFEEGLALATESGESELTERAAAGLRGSPTPVE